MILGGVAAYYSVFGLSKLFAGSFLPILIMAGTIEISKLVAVTTLKRYWDNLKLFTRIYLFVSIFAIMILTSAGIYGFLTNSYQQTIGQQSVNDVTVRNLEFTRDNFIKKIELVKSNNLRYEERIGTLNDIRSSQEVRLDSLYKIRYFNTAKKVENQIEISNNEIKELRDKINANIDEIGKFNDSIASYEIQIVKTSLDESTAELGPLIYISQLTGYPMDQIINYFVLLIIFVFDPMAIILLMAYNEISSNENVPNKPVNVMDNIPDNTNDIGDEITASDYGDLEINNEADIYNEELYPESFDIFDNDISTNDIEEVDSKNEFNKKINAAKARINNSVGGFRASN